MSIFEEICAAIRGLEKRAAPIDTVPHFGDGMSLVTSEDGIPVPYNDNTIIRDDSIPGRQISISGLKSDDARERNRQAYVEAFGEDPYTKSRREALLFGAAAMPAAVYASEIASSAPVVNGVRMSVTKGIPAMWRFVRGNTVKDIVARTTGKPIAGTVARSIFRKIPFVAGATNLALDGVKDVNQVVPDRARNTLSTLSLLSPSGWGWYAARKGLEIGAKNNPELIGEIAGNGLSLATEYSRNWIDNHRKGAIHKSYRPDVRSEAAEDYGARVVNGLRRVPQAAQTISRVAQLVDDAAAMRRNIEDVRRADSWHDYVMPMSEMAMRIPRVQEHVDTAGQDVADAAKYLYDVGTDMLIRPTGKPRSNTDQSD